MRDIIGDKRIHILEFWPQSSAMDLLMFIVSFLKFTVVLSEIVLEFGSIDLSFLLPVRVVLEWCFL